MQDPPSFGNRKRVWWRPVHGITLGRVTDMGSAQQGGRTLPTIGRYKLVREIGRGGMAVVYLARDRPISTATWR